jgi:hypothetical protein
MRSTSRSGLRSSLYFVSLRLSHLVSLSTLLSSPQASRGGVVLPLGGRYELLFGDVSPAGRASLRRAPAAGVQR